MEIEFSKKFKQRSENHVSEVFKFDGQWYYADITNVPFTGNECMIFKAKNESGDVKNWMEVYCNRRVEITRECLTDCILEFVTKRASEVTSQEN